MEMHQEAIKEMMPENITLKRPRFGFSFPAKTLRAVDFPMPLVPTRPRTCPGLGTGNLLSSFLLCQTKEKDIHDFFFFSGKEIEN